MLVAKEGRWKLRDRVTAIHVTKILHAAERGHKIMVSHTGRPDRVQGAGPVYAREERRQCRSQAMPGKKQSAIECPNHGKESLLNFSQRVFEPVENFASALPIHKFRFHIIEQISGVVFVRAPESHDCQFVFFHHVIMQRHKAMRAAVSVVPLTLEISRDLETPRAALVLDAIPVKGKIRVLVAICQPRHPGTELRIASWRLPGKQIQRLGRVEKVLLTRAVGNALAHVYPPRRTSRAYHCCFQNYWKSRHFGARPRGNLSVQYIECVTCKAGRGPLRLQARRKLRITSCPISNRNSLPWDLSGMWPFFSPPLVTKQRMRWPPRSAAMTPRLPADRFRGIPFRTS